MNVFVYNSIEVFWRLSKSLKLWRIDNVNASIEHNKVFFSVLQVCHWIGRMYFDLPFCVKSVKKVKLNVGNYIFWHFEREREKVSVFGERERERSTRKKDRQHTCHTKSKLGFLRSREGQNKNCSKCMYFDLLFVLFTLFTLFT